MDLSAVHPIDPAAPGRAASPVAKAAHAVERLIGTTVELVAAALIAVEIGILLAGVVSRYLLNAPITWTDEAASILFLWLASLGAVVALRRGEHMRMTALVAKVSPATRELLDVIGIAATLAYLLMVIHPAYEFAVEEAVVTTPSLEISNAWRVSATLSSTRLMP